MRVIAVVTTTSPLLLRDADAQVAALSDLRIHPTSSEPKGLAIQC
jgi:hypothetical protein